MNSTEKSFLQVILLLLALLFTFTVRYLDESREAQAGTFSPPETQNVTISEVFYSMLPERR